MSLAARTPRGRLGQQRGIALIIVLVVVALLTITVVELTYSVQLDQHRVRNSIHALQSLLLARSGVNLAEGFLTLDDDPRFDSPIEQWWVDLLDFCRGLPLDETMRIRCRVEDESGKINVNATRGPREVETANVRREGVLRNAMRHIFQSRNIEVDIVDRLVEYWGEQRESADGRTFQVPEFTSLEDFAAHFGIPSRELHGLRPVMTALPIRFINRINANTAPLEVLSAVLEDSAAAEEIIAARRGEDPGQIESEIKSIIGQVEHGSVRNGIFGYQSRVFRLEASALTNVDPLADEEISGIGQTLSVLVLRAQGRRRPGQDPDLPSWTLRPLDWQKEGGARLFWMAREDEEGFLTEGSGDLQGGRF